MRDTGLRPYPGSPQLGELVSHPEGQGHACVTLCHEWDIQLHLQQH